MNDTRTIRRGWLSPLRIIFPAFLLAGLMAVGLAARQPTTPAVAIAPCVPHSNTAEEVTMLGMVNTWRAQNVAGAQPLTMTSSLNAAAKGYAQYLVDAGGTGHYADGSDWGARAQQCGFASNSRGQVAGGEGLGRAASPDAALAEMATHQGSGIFIPASVGLPVKCAGVAKATSSDGARTAWIVLLFAREGDCPGAATVATSTPTATATTSFPTSTPTKSATTGVPTSTPTKTPTTGLPTSTPTQILPPTATATPSPTTTVVPVPAANYGLTITIYESWNLVTLPEGPIADILDTATGCYTAVYRLEGDGWGRFSPEAPAYANSLTWSNGGAIWLEGSGDCGDIDI